VGVLAALAPLAIVMAWIGLTAIRPQVFTVTLLALWLSFIEADRRGRRTWMTIAVPAYVAWLNLHAGFVVGWGFLVLHAIEQAWRRRPFVHLAVLAAACVALVAVNPYGLDYYSYLVRALTMDRPLIGEWRPIWQAHPVAMAVYGCSVVVAIGAIAQVGLRDATGWPILAAAAYLAARHERHVSMYALVWFAYVPAFVARTSAGRLLDRAWNRPVRAPLRAATGVLVIAVAVSFALRRPWQLTVPGAMQTAAPVPYPVGAVAYLDAHDVRGNLFTPFVVGAYVSWKLHPRVKVSLDSRYEVAYPPDALERNLQFYDGSADWRAILERDPTDLVLVPRTAPVAGELATQATWTRVYEDDAYVLFAKDHVGLPVENRRGTGLIGRLP
jgi:hypothetical protein